MSILARIAASPSEDVAAAVAVGIEVVAVGFAAAAVAVPGVAGSHPQLDLAPRHSTGNLPSVCSRR